MAPRHASGRDSARSVGPPWHTRAHRAARRTSPVRSSVRSVEPRCRRLPRSGATTSPSPGAERRVVSVLFADLVGYTALEGRDFEDVRDLQSRYFDAARTVIERYGGALEKFIGDAVMAVWGAPVAREDDAERAVRAALEPRRRRGHDGIRQRVGRSPTPCGSTHRRGRGHDRSRGPGHGHRRPRQHRVADPGRRGSGHGARRRLDTGQPRRRSPTRRPASATSRKGRARTLPARAASHRQPRRRGALRRPRVLPSWAASAS